MAVKNSKSVGGYKSATFAAIWAMLLVILFAYQGALVVFYGRASAVVVGCVIGASAMMCQLFFVLMVVFFVLGKEATDMNFGEKEISEFHMNVFSCCFL